MRLTNLADHLRQWGLEVVEVDGWRGRGADFPKKPSVVVAHHTGTPHSNKSDYPTLHIVRDGRSDLPGPLCQVGLGYSGKVYVVAAGKANHAGKGHWAGHVVGNSDSVGIEAESPGDGTWTAAQRATYPRLCAALCALLGSPATLVCGHRESAEPHGRKVDPTGIDLDRLRADTARLLKAGPVVKPYPTLRYPMGGDGHPSSAVHNLQKLLGLPGDGVFTLKVQAVVKNKQRELGQRETGVADPRFLQAIGFRP